VRIWLPYHIRRSAGLAARGSTSGSRERPSARHFHRRFGNRVFINRSPGCKHHAGQFAGAACLVSFPVALASQQMQ
jgi:hypothetical protein